MFDVGFAELALLAVLGLLVLGPERLPGVARMIGGYLRKARRTWNTVRAEIEAELAADEIRKQVQEPLDEFDELRRATAAAAAGRPAHGDPKPENDSTTAEDPVEPEPESDPESEPSSDEDRKTDSP